MAALQDERTYGLSCVKEAERLSVHHVKLTLSAIRAIENYQNSKKIIIPWPDSETEVKPLTFDVANVARDDPHGSFMCVQQHKKSNGKEKLHSLGSIQERITIHASDDTYDKARQSMAQAKEDDKNRSAIVLKLDGSYEDNKLPVRKPAHGVSDEAPTRKRPTPVNIASLMKKSSISRRPFRERVMHLLALKPYNKPELLLRLQKDGLSTEDKDSLDGLMQQVGSLCAKDCTYTLNDNMYAEVQRNWPGYSEEDQQLLKRILVRKLRQEHKLSGQSEPTTPHIPISQKRPATNKAEATDPVCNKKHRISHFSQPKPAFNGKVNSSNGKGPLSVPADLFTPDLVSSSSHLPGLQDIISNSSSGEQRDCINQEASERLVHPPQTNCGVKNKRKTRYSTHGKQRIPGREKPHKERSSGKKPKSDPTSSTLQNDTDPNGACGVSSIPTSTSDTPDYILKYPAISTSDQRQKYKNDFNAEYLTYRDLHARIERVTRRFTLLDEKLKQLLPGTEDYKTIHDEILQEYYNIKKTNPNYSGDKQQCEHLHNKLAHIKKIIAQYDQLH
uniref:Elongation factor for RNA polymerase II n=1 Tax=Leptobrachium leishanense TaxID=445787 RepID=A0A8C5M7G0_9ANUR